MGSAESLYECPNIETSSNYDPEAPIEFEICTEEWYWLKSNWTTALWITFSVMSGIFSGGMFYICYLIVLEWFRSWPVNMMEYLGGVVNVNDLRWPPFFGIKHGTSKI